jgi:hypothetical protein
MSRLTNIIMVGFGKTNDGWQHDLNPKSELTGDDLQILIDLIEENLMK